MKKPQGDEKMKKKRYETFVEYQDERPVTTGRLFEHIEHAKEDALNISSSGLLGGMAYVLDRSSDSFVGYYPAGAASKHDWHWNKKFHTIEQETTQGDAPPSVAEAIASAAELIASAIHSEESPDFCSESLELLEDCFYALDISDYGNKSSRSRADSMKKRIVSHLEKFPQQ